MITWWRRVLIAVSACAAVLASFVFLRDLAVHAGWPVWTSPLLPLSIDALAAAALTEYRRSRSRTAAAVSVGAIAASVAGNAVSHLISTGLLIPGWVVVTAVGSVPAITVGLVVHLFTARDQSWKSSDTAPIDGYRSLSAGSQDTAIPPVPMPPTTTGVPAVSSGRSRTDTRARRRTDTDEDLLRLIHERGLQAATLTTLTSELSVSRTRATRLRKMLDEHYRQYRNGSPSARQESAA